MMMPYFFAAGHIMQCMEPTISMTQKRYHSQFFISFYEASILPDTTEVFGMAYIWSDMFIESSFMKYGKCSGGLIGLALNENQ